MSFYSFKNNGNDRSPGLIDVKALNRITERVCIQVNKVYDACLQQESFPNTQVVLPALSGTAPYTFISLRNSISQGNVENLSVTRLSDRPNCARVQADILIPVQVNYSDATGTEYLSTGSISVHKDVILYVPDDSIIPYSIEATVGAISVIGTLVTTGDTATLTADVCISIITRVIATVDLLVPAFGFTEIPPCEEYADEACDNFFCLPLFPPQMEDVISNNNCLGSSFYNSRTDK